MTPLTCYTRFPYKYSPAGDWNRWKNSRPCTSLLYIGYIWQFPFKFQWTHVDDGISFCIEITGIYPSEGSLQGGTRILVEGNHFDDTTEPLKIFIGGVPCEVVSGTLTTASVECIAGDPPAEKSYYSGYELHFYCFSACGIELELNSRVWKSEYCRRTFRQYVGLLIVTQNYVEHLQYWSSDDLCIILYITCIVYINIFSI